MFYPEPIVLSPGLAKEVDVVFRPVEYEPYDDTIYIKMLDGISGNGFHIPVRATIDNLSLKAPEGLDLGYCATHQITQLTFHLVNNGEIDAPYEWDVPEPFSLVPSSGVVPVGKFHEITLSIRPTDASVFVAQALCHVGRGVHAIIPNPVLVTKLSAIGKFAYIAVSDQVVSFDEVVSGMIPEAKEIVLANNSVVPAEFQLIRLDSDRDEVFDIHPKSGVIPPRGELPVSIQYRALAMGCYTHDRYAFRTPGNCNTVFTLKGTSMPPRVTLFKEVVPAKASAQTSETSLTLGSSLLSEEGAPHFSLNFRDIEVGKVETRLLYLRNDSPRDVPFSVIGDENGIFKMTPKQGIVPALVKSFPVKVVFVPPKPINYYRRFFVLVGDAQPLFYDCLGTGFIRAKGEVKEQRPAPIRHAHVQAYRNRSVQGFGGLNPDELDALHENPDVPAHFFAQIGRVGTKAFSVTQLQRPVTRTGESLRNLVAPAHEFFVQGNDSTAREVTVNRLSLDFGYTPFKTSSRPKEVVIHNHTNGKVVVQWYVPPVAGMDRLVAADGGNGHGGKGRDIITADREEKELAALQAFSVTPMTADINPGQSFSFQISFVPKQSSRNFLSELEAVVYFKNQRTFRLVNDFSLTPPWSLTLSCLGHTFSSGQLLAKAAFFGGCVAHNKLVFPACYLGEATYQTVLIRNTSNLPCTFHIEVGWRARHNFQTDAAEGEITSATATAAGPGGSVFSVKPDVGEIAAESFVLVCVRFSPQILKKYSDVLRLVVNGEEGEKLLLEGAGAVPYVIIPDLYEQQAVFPEEILGINKRSMTSAELIPRDTLGTLYMKPTCLGLSSTRTVTLKNATRLPLKYRVLLPAQAAKEDLLAVTPMVGVLKGNDEVQLSLTFRPHRIKSYNFKLTVQVFPIGGRPKRVLDANQPGPVEPPEVVQECSFILNAAGEMGALLFDPAETVAEVRLVHTKEEKAIWLENASDSDLAYRLLYQELFQPDSVELRQDKFLSDIRPLRPVAGHPAAAAATSHDRTAATSSASTTALEKTAPGHGPSPGAFTDSLFCEQHEGVIPARSRLRCIFTYTPVKSGLFEFTLFAQITALHPQTRQPVLLPNDAAALMKLTGSLQAEDLAAVGMASLNLTDGPAAAQTSRPADLSLLPLRASFTARAAFPKLLFEDIRMDNQDQPAASVTALWDRFSLPLLNYDLSIPLTAEEIALNHSSSPDLGRLRVYNFEFLPQVLNSPAQAATIRLRNHGYLPTTFHFHLPNEKQLELENWCDEEDPSEELNRLICIIEELKLFSVEPKEKTLLPGEVCELRLTYRHSSLKYNGLHNIPILVKIAQGKQFYINLKGQTLAALSKKSSVKFIDAKAAAAASSGMQSPVSRGQSLEEGGRKTSAAGGGSATAALLGTNPAEILLVFPNCGTNDYLFHRIRLRPVPLGLSPAPTNGLPLRQGTARDYAPLQRVELVNVSAHSVNYEVILGHHVDRAGDLPALFVTNAIAAGHHEMDVLALANPVGTIAAASSVFLEFFFYPLEARLHSFPLTVKYALAPPAPTGPTFSAMTASFDTEAGPATPAIVIGGAGGKGPAPTSILSRGGGTKGKKGRRDPAATAGFGQPLPVTYEYLTATLEAVGYDPREKRPVPYECEYIGGTPPPRPVLEFPERPLVLAADLVDFGLVAQLSTARRVFVLHNQSVTSAFEFAVDETSCSLCIDGLLAVRPLFGKIEPRGSVLVELILRPFCQSAVVAENLKIMVREVLKAANKSRGGTRQQLLDRIKSSRQSSTAEHESVVARTTFTRSVQILLADQGAVHSSLPALMQLQEEAEALGVTDQKLTASGVLGEHTSLAASVGPNGSVAPAEDREAQAADKNNPFAPQSKTAKFPVTVGKDGRLVEGNFTQAVRSLRPPGSLQPDELFAELPGAPEVLQMDPGRGAGSPNSRQSRSGGGLAAASYDSFTAGPASPARTEAGASSRGGQSRGSTGLKSAHGGESRGGLLSSGHSLSSQGNGAAVRYGLSYSLLLRLSGEIYSRETIEGVHKLCADNYAALFLARDNELLLPAVYQQRRPFVPLPPRKFFDADFSAEMAAVRGRAKVNVSFLDGRFAEFRHVSAALMSSLWNGLLSSVAADYFLQNLVPETALPTTPSPSQPAAVPGLLNSHFLPLQVRPKLNPFDAAPSRPYGVFFNELAAARELSPAQLLIVELKHLGLLSRAQADHEAAHSRKAGERPWQRMDEAALLADQADYSLPAGELLAVLADWSLADKKEFAAAVSALENR